MKTEFVRVVLQIVSVVLLIPSVMLVMQDMTLKTVSVLLPASPVPVDNSDTMDSATLNVQLVLANKETSVKELALPELGHTMEDATELAQPNSPLPMLASTLAQLELHLSMEFVKSDLEPVLQDNSGMEQALHAKTVNILVLNVN